ncbi:MAG: hypothetical protein P1Q69_15790 [Candidatus Thorarchaeota archaeon]|nr:hypothetical protein [Candidatus Thorarchaeota archaeon]
MKVPINWEIMTERTKQRLREALGRDTRVIHAFLRIIEQHEDELLIGKNKNRIDSSKLDQLTMTSLKVKSGFKQRPNVPHDFKTRFPRISQNELQECRQTAVALFESYRALKGMKGRFASRPTSINCSRRIPRWIFTQRFQLYEKKTSISRWWLDVRDSLDSVHEGRVHHDRLNIPLKMSPYHLNQINKGEIKALQIFTDRKRKWWASIAVRIHTTGILKSDFPVAILGIDLGIEKAGCSTLLTPEKVRETRFFVQKDKVINLLKYDNLVADLQRELHLRRVAGLDSDEVSRRLRRIRSKRERVLHESMIGFLFGSYLTISRNYPRNIHSMLLLVV